MRKHRHAKERQSQETPTSREGDKCRPQESGGSGQPTGGAMDGPASHVRPASRPGPTHEQIALRAYENWVARGGPAGSDWEDWFEAERQLRMMIKSSSVDDDPEKETIRAGTGRHKFSDAVPHEQHKAGDNKGGRPVPTHETAEQIREAKESEETRGAKTSNRDRMVDMGWGNQQAGRQSQ